MAEHTITGRRFRFGLFVADPQTGELQKAGRPQKIQAQPFKILVTLLERPGDIVSRSELRQELWSDGTTVDFDARLGTAMNKLREALGDSAENPRFVETLPGHGYRFIAPVVVEVAETLVAGNHDLESSGLKSSDSPISSLFTQPPAEDVHSSSTARRKWQILGSIVAALGLCGIFFWEQAHLQFGSPAPRIFQVTTSGSVSPGDTFLESLPGAVTDGIRLYFPQIEGGQTRLAQVVIANGEASDLALPGEIIAPLLGNISPDGSRMLVRNRIAGEPEHTIWVVPTTGVGARQIYGVLAHDATWMPDGQRILYANGNALFTARENGTDVRQFVALPGRAFWLRWSPDGSKLRLTLLNSENHTTALWEISSDGTDLHPLLADWSTPAHECCGSWTTDGKYFVFQSSHSGNANIWMLPERNSLFQFAPRPVRLTSGPLDYQAPITAPSGDEVFFIGTESRSDFLRYSAKTRSFLSYRSDLTAPFHVEFSRDGHFIAWIGQDASLWRSRVDGSEKMRLTEQPLQVFLMRWSPDTKQLLFMARQPGKLWQLFAIDADGSHLHPVLQENRNEADPDWSPDGQQIVFGRVPALMGEASESKAIYLLDLTSGKMTQLPGSEGLFSPRWSPDGRYIAALSLNMYKLMLYDTATKSWRTLASQSSAEPIWSHSRKFLYFTDYVQKDRTIYRISVPNGTVEKVVDLADVHSAIDYNFAGLTPDDEPLVNARMFTTNIYAMQLGEK